MHVHDAVRSQLCHALGEPRGSDPTLHTKSTAGPIAQHIQDRAGQDPPHLRQFKHKLAWGGGLGEFFGDLAVPAVQRNQLLHSPQNLVVVLLQLRVGRHHLSLTDPSHAQVLAVAHALFCTNTGTRTRKHLKTMWASQPVSVGWSDFRCPYSIVGPRCTLRARTAA